MTTHFLLVEQFFDKFLLNVFGEDLICFLYSVRQRSHDLGQNREHLNFMCCAVSKVICTGQETGGFTRPPCEGKVMGLINPSLSKCPWAQGHNTDAQTCSWPLNDDPSMKTVHLMLCLHPKCLLFCTDLLLSSHLLSGWSHSFFVMWPISDSCLHKSDFWGDPHVPNNNTKDFKHSMFPAEVYKQIKGHFKVTVHGVSSCRHAAWKLLFSGIIQFDQLKNGKLPLVIYFVWVCGLFKVHYNGLNVCSHIILWPHSAISFFKFTLTSCCIEATFKTIMCPDSSLILNICSCKKKDKFSRLKVTSAQICFHVRISDTSAFKMSGFSVQTLIKKQTCVTMKR